MNEEITEAAKLLAEHFSQAQDGKAFKIDYSSPDFPDVKITVTDLTKKPKLNYAEAFEVMKAGKQVRLFNESLDDCKWIEYIHGKGFYIMTGTGLVEWNPSPTINDLQFDCFVIVGRGV